MPYQTQVSTSPEYSRKTSSSWRRDSVKFQRATENVLSLPLLFITSGYRIVRAAAHNPPPYHPSIHFSSLAGRRDLQVFFRSRKHTLRSLLPSGLKNDKTIYNSLIYYEMNLTQHGMEVSNKAIAKEKHIKRADLHLSRPHLCAVSNTSIYITWV